MAPLDNSKETNMTTRTLTEWIDSQDDDGRTFAQERLIAAATEEVWARMEERDMNKVELAARLGRSKAYVSQVLNGTRNMTLRTLSDFAFAVDCSVMVYLCDRHANRGWEPLVDAVHGQRRPPLPDTVTVVDISDLAGQRRLGAQVAETVAAEAA